MTDLTREALKNCPAVERSPHVVGGEWVFKGTRVPVAALIQNLKAGASIGQFLEWFPGVERSQVDLVLDHLRKATQSGQSLRETMEEISRSARDRGLTPEILRSILEER